MLWNWPVKLYLLYNSHCDVATHAEGHFHLVHLVSSCIAPSLAHSRLSKVLVHKLIENRMSGSEQLLFAHLVPHTHDRLLPLFALTQTDDSMWPLVAVASAAAGDHPNQE